MTDRKLASMVLSPSIFTFSEPQVAIADTLRARRSLNTAQLLRPGSFTPASSSGISTPTDDGPSTPPVRPARHVPAALSIKTRDWTQARASPSSWSPDAFSPAEAKRGGEAVVEDDDDMSVSYSAAIARLDDVLGAPARSSPPPVDAQRDSLIESSVGHDSCSELASPVTLQRASTYRFSAPRTVSLFSRPTIRTRPGSRTTSAFEEDASWGPPPLPGSPIVVRGRASLVAATLPVDTPAPDSPHSAISHQASFVSVVPPPLIRPPPALRPDALPRTWSRSNEIPVPSFCPLPPGFGGTPPRTPRSVARSQTSSRTAKSRHVSLAPSTASSVHSALDPAIMSPHRPLSDVTEAPTPSTASSAAPFRDLMFNTTRDTPPTTAIDPFEDGAAGRDDEEDEEDGTESRIVPDWPRPPSRVHGREHRRKLFGSTQGLSLHASDIDGPPHAPAPSVASASTRAPSRKHHHRRLPSFAASVKSPSSMYAGSVSGRRRIGRHERRRTFFLSWLARDFPWAAGLPAGDEAPPVPEIPVNLRVDLEKPMLLGSGITNTIPSAKLLRRGGSSRIWLVLVCALILCAICGLAGSVVLLARH